MLVVLVSTEDPGLEIFPTHRVFAGPQRARRASASRWTIREARSARSSATSTSPARRRGRPATALRRPRRAGPARRPARRHARARRARLHARRGRGAAPRARGRGGGRVPAAADADRGRLRRRAARRGAAAEDDVLLPEAHLRPALPPAVSRLARGLPRRPSPTSARARDAARRASSASPSSERAWAATTRPRSTRRRKRVVVARLRAGRRGLHARLRGARRGELRLGGPVARRRRPDRRLAEREARHPVLLALGRRRGRRHDGRRRLRLRLRLRHGRGVDGDARRRRVPERRRARRAPPEGRDRDPLLRGDDHRRGRREGRGRRRRRLPAADHGLARALALPPRGRPRRRRLLAEARALGRHRRGAAARPGAGLAIELFEDAPFAAAPLDLAGVRASSRRAHELPTLCARTAG